VAIRPKFASPVAMRVMHFSHVSQVRPKNPFRGTRAENHDGLAELHGVVDGHGLISHAKGLGHTGLLHGNALRDPVENSGGRHGVFREDPVYAVAVGARLRALPI